MSFKTFSCVEFECDACGSDAWDYYDGVPHFPGTLAEGLAELKRTHDWIVEGDKHWCPECVPLDALERVSEATDG